MHPAATTPPRLLVFSACCCLAALPHPALANGGGYSSGGVERAGDLTRFQPEATEFVRMLDEQLTIKLGPAAAQVEIRYLMRNTTDRKITVKFGFPVEELIPPNTFEGVDSHKKSWPKPEYCRDYQLTARGAAVKHTWQNEPAGAADTRRRGLSGWQVSSLTFAANEEVPVAIRFESPYPRSGWGVSDDSSDAASIFKYRLSTAACWAGTIGTGRITLKPDGIDPAELRVLKPVNRFKKQGTSWVWNFENLEPTMADDMEIEAVPATNSFTRPVRENDYQGPHVTYTERSGKWSVEHSNYAATASSTLPPEGGKDYSVNQLKSWGGAWSEGKPGPGIGEWLELRPVEPKPLHAILIRPGYASSDELFKANARPKLVEITLNGDHTFTAGIPDQNSECRIPVTGYQKPVRTLKLVFKEVWPGSRFEDLCVSDISLSVRLDRKPKISPQR